MTPMTVLPAGPKYKLTLQDALQRIKVYHQDLGHPDDNKKILQNHRTYCLAMMAEAAEVLNAAPWKPWKAPMQQSITDSHAMITHITEELVDVFFFISSLLEIWGVSPDRFEEAFENKMAINYGRIATGYHGSDDILPTPTA